MSSPHTSRSSLLFVLALTATLATAGTTLASESAVAGLDLVEATTESGADESILPEQETPVRLGFGSPPAGPQGGGGQAGAFKRWGSVNLGARVSSEAAEGLVNLFAPLRETANGLWFLDARFVVNDVDEDTSSLGIGYRHRLSSGGILGATAYYDRISSAFGNDFNQLGLGFELLTNRVDARINGYFPESPKVFDTVVMPFYGATSAKGHKVFQEIGSTSMVRREGALDGFSGEVGFRVTPDDSVWAVRVFGGYYDFDTDVGIDYDGFKGRVELKAGRFLTFDAIYYDDEELLGGGNWAGAVRVTIPLGGGFKDGWTALAQEDRLGEFVHRSPLTRSHGGDEFEQGPVTGLEVTEVLDNVFHVDTDGGNGMNGGSAESMFDSLEDAIAAARDSGADATILVTGGGMSAGDYEFDEHSMAIFSSATGIPVFGGGNFGYDGADNIRHEGNFTATGIGFFSLGGFDLHGEGGTGIETMNVGCVTSIGNSFHGFDTGLSVWNDNPSLTETCLEVHDNLFDGGYTGVFVHDETGGLLTANLSGNLFDEQHGYGLDMESFGSGTALSLLTNEFFGELEEGYDDAQLAYYSYYTTTDGVHIHTFNESTLTADVRNNTFVENDYAFSVQVGADPEEEHEEASLAGHEFGESTATLNFSGNTWSGNYLAINAGAYDDSMLTVSVMGDTFGGTADYQASYGIYVYAYNSTVDLTVMGSSFDEFDDEAIEVDLEQASTGTFWGQGNTFTDNYHDMYFDVEDGSVLTATADRNVSTGVRDDFFEIDEIDRDGTVVATVSNNLVTNGDGVGVLAAVDDDSHLTLNVMGNTFSGLAGYGVLIEEVDEGSTANVNIWDNTFQEDDEDSDEADGIAVFGVTEGSTLNLDVSDNHFTGLDFGAWIGPIVDSTVNWTVTGNFFTNIFRDALELATPSEGSDVTFDVNDNIFADVGGAAVSVLGLESGSTLGLDMWENTVSGAGAGFLLGEVAAGEAMPLEHGTPNAILDLWIDDNAFTNVNVGVDLREGIRHGGEATVDVTNNVFTNVSQGVSAFASEGGILDIDVSDNRFLFTGEGESQSARLSEYSNAGVVVFSEGGDLTATVNRNDILGHDFAILLGGLGGSFGGTVNWNSLRYGGTGISFFREGGGDASSTFTAGGNTVSFFGVGFRVEADDTTFSSDIDGVTENNRVTQSEGTFEVSGEGNTGGLRVNGEDLDVNSVP